MAQVPCQLRWRQLAPTKTQTPAASKSLQGGRQASSPYGTRQPQQRALSLRGTRRSPFRKTLPVSTASSAPGPFCKPDNTYTHEAYARIADPERARGTFVQGRACPKRRRRLQHPVLPNSRMNRRAPSPGDAHQAPCLSKKEPAPRRRVRRALRAQAESGHPCLMATEPECRDSRRCTRRSFPSGGSSRHASSWHTSGRCLLRS
mmetsp:Transcript_57729/g.160950  ORF Transcript_57729/g.160950 Transcript_57729/m.160950 type:complete len:204 (-) Transcript_57729:458-1069(-)